MADFDKDTPPKRKAAQVKRRERFDVGGFVNDMLDRAKKNQADEVKRENAKTLMREGIADLAYGLEHIESAMKRFEAADMGAVITLDTMRNGLNVLKSVLKSAESAERGLHG